MQTIKEKLKKAIEKRFLKVIGTVNEKGHYSDKNFCTFATLLDPRFKTRSLKDEEVGHRRASCSR